MKYTEKYVEKIIKERNELKRLASELIEVIKNSDLQISSNDLGNAIDALEDAINENTHLR